MLQRSKHKETCQCCADVAPQWTYRWMSYRYCANCLHSIGITTSGNECSSGLYRQAWRYLNEGRPS